jgi:hypothetical protein
MTFEKKNPIKASIAYYKQAVQNSNLMFVQDYFYKTCA